MCVYEAMCSAVKISTVESPRDKASTDIVPPRVGRLSFPFPIGHLGKGQAEKLNQPIGERWESHIEVEHLGPTTSNQYVKNFEG